MRTSNVFLSFGSFSLALAAVLWALAVAGCSSGDESGGAATTTASVSAAEASGFCDAYCKKSASCDGRLDVQTCTIRCEDSITSELQRLRPELVDGTRTCFEASDCRQVLEGKRLSECIDEAATAVTPSRGVLEYCDALSAAWKECLDVDYSRAVCMNGSKAYSDATLAEASKCMAKSCKQRFECQAAVLGWN